VRQFVTVTVADQPDSLAGSNVFSTPPNLRPTVGGVEARRLPSATGATSAHEGHNAFECPK
jgi:hypothetical protein